MIGVLVVVALASAALAASGYTGGFTPVFTFSFLVASALLVFALAMRRSQRRTRAEVPPQREDRT